MKVDIFNHNSLFTFLFTLFFDLLTLPVKGMCLLVKVIYTRFTSKTQTKNTNLR